MTFNSETERMSHPQCNEKIYEDFNQELMAADLDILLSSLEDGLNTDALSEDEKLQLAGQLMMRPEYALIAAALFGSLTMVKQLLLDQPLLQDMLEFEGYRAFRLAVLQGHFDVVKYFIEINPDSGKHAWMVVSAFSLAAANGHFDMMEHFLTCALEADIEQGLFGLFGDIEEGKRGFFMFSAFCEACTNGHTAVVDRLLIIPFIFCNAEILEKENGKTPIHSFLKERLTAFRSQRQVSGLPSNNGIFAPTPLSTGVKLNTAIAAKAATHSQPGSGMKG